MLNQVSKFKYLEDAIKEGWNKNMEKLVYVNGKDACILTREIENIPERIETNVDIEKTGGNEGMMT